MYILPTPFSTSRMPRFLVVKVTDEISNEWPANPTSGERGGRVCVKEEENL